MPRRMTQGRRCSNREVWFGLRQNEANVGLLVELEKAKESKYFPSIMIVNMENIGYFDAKNMEYC